MIWPRVASAKEKDIHYAHLRSHKYTNSRNVEFPQTDNREVTAISTLNIRIYNSLVYRPAVFLFECAHSKHFRWWCGVRRNIINCTGRVNVNVTYARLTRKSMCDLSCTYIENYLDILWWNSFLIISQMELYKYILMFCIIILTYSNNYWQYCWWFYD